MIPHLFEDHWHLLENQPFWNHVELLESCREPPGLYGSVLLPLELEGLGGM